MEDELSTRLKLLREDIAEVEELLEPKLYVLTQSGRNIVPVDIFYADGISVDEFLIIASHRGDKRWNVLGAYDTKKRAVQVYEEMLRCPKDKVFEMPQR